MLWCSDAIDHIEWSLAVHKVVEFNPSLLVGCRSSDCLNHTYPPRWKTLITPEPCDAIIRMCFLIIFDITSLPIPGSRSSKLLNCYPTRLKVHVRVLAMPDA